VISVAGEGFEPP